MKNFVKVIAVVVAVLAFSSCGDKFGAKDALLGWMWNPRTHAPEVINLDGDPVGRAETMPALLAPDTIQLQGNSGATVEGQWVKDSITTMGDQVEFVFKYDGSKHSQINAQVALALRFEGSDVYALDKYTLRGTLREVSHDDAPFLQTNIASLVLTSESGDQVIRKDVVLMIGAALRDTVIVHDTTTIHDTTTTIVHDTVHVHHRDTVYVHDTVNMRDTITLHDTVYVHDSIDVIRTTQYIMEHLNWNQTAQLLNGKLYVYGTDKVTKIVYENGVEQYRRSTNYGHKSRFRLVGFNNVVFASAQNVCVDVVNGTATIAAQQFQIIWEADEIVDNSVIVDGENVRDQLTPCHATARQLCATTSGNLVIHFADATDDDIATYTTTYTVPTPGQWPSTALAWGSDSYFTDIVDNIDEDRQTNAVIIVPSTLKFYAHEWQSGITRNSCDSVTLTNAEYSFIMSKVNSTTENWVPCKVYDHNNPNIWYAGVVRSQQLSNGSWKLTYMMADGTLAYYMSQSSWTVAGYSGRDANRGVMDANGTLSFDGISLQIHN